MDPAKLVKPKRVSFLRAKEIGPRETPKGVAIVFFVMIYE